MTGLIPAGPDGKMWFTDGTGDKVGSISMGGVISEYKLPSRAAGPLGITSGPDGALWFTETYKHQIGRVTTTGSITEYQAGFGKNMNGIAAGADGKLWYSGGVSGEISSITTSGTVTHYMTRGYTHDVTSASDGNIWFTEGGDLIGRVTPSGVVTEYSIPNGLPLNEISQGPGGWLWISQPDQFFGQSAFARFDPVRQKYIDTILLPSPFVNPNESVLGPDGNMWFTDYQANLIGVYVIQVLTAQPRRISFAEIGLSQDLQVAEKRYSGGFMATTTNPSVATVAPGGSQGDFIVTSVGPGSCKIVVSDTQQNSVAVHVSVQ